MKGPPLIGSAYEVQIQPGGQEAAIYRTADKTLTGVTDLNGRSAADLRRLADAIDIARGRLPV